MAWYKTSTITVTNGSLTVSGAATAWISNAAIGEALYAPDGRLYEITNIASDTTMTITPAYLGATASAQAYVIVPSQSYIRDLAAQAADLVNNYSTIYNTVGQGKFGDGTLGAPGIRFSDDLDTGFHRSATNEVTFVAGGTAIFKYSLTGGLSLSTGGALVGTTATQTLTNKTLTAPVINSPTGLVKADVGLGNVDNTSDATKNSATATLTNKTLTAPVFGGTVTGTYTLGGTPTFPSSVVLTTGAQTLASKTLTNPVINGFTGDTSIINIGSGQVYKDASGNVGLGISSGLQGKFHIGGTAAGSAQAVLTNGASDPKFQLHVVNGASGFTSGIIQGYLALAYEGVGYGPQISFRRGGNTTDGYLTFDMQGFEQMQLSSSGNLGLGVTPSAWQSGISALDAGSVGSFFAGSTSTNLATNAYLATGGWTYKTTNFATRYATTTSGQHQWFTAPSGTAGNTISFTQAMTLDSSGNLLVGTTSDSGARLRVNFTGVSTGVRIGTTATSGTAVQFVYEPATQVGTITTTTTATSYNTSSDYRLKENVAPMQGALAKVQALNPVTYTWKADGSAGQGFIAHELQAVVPDCVTGEKDAVDAEGNPQYQGVDTSFLVATLVAAIQELKSEFDAYKLSHP